MISNPIIKSLLVFLLILFIVAPFAGLVPLMLLLLFAGVFYAIAPIFEVSSHNPDSESSQASGD
jgi:hypothetical protein